MKNLLTLIVLTATFLFGYHLGRKPDSPDVIGWLNVKSQEAYVAGRGAAAAIGEKYQEITVESEYSH